jgi:hypothetical protein
LESSHSASDLARYHEQHRDDPDEWEERGEIVMPQRRFTWSRFEVDQGDREVCCLIDNRPPPGPGFDRHRVTGWLPADPHTVSTVRELCAFLNKCCPPHLLADEFWRNLHSDEG